MKVKTIEEAWNEANKIFPTDYEKDEFSSSRAGYPIYRSTAEGHENDYISDLNDRLEINIFRNNLRLETTNIWIVTEEQGEDIAVEVKAVKSNDCKNYRTYASFIKDFRFFHSSGARFNDAEEKFEKIISVLRDTDIDKSKFEIVYSGMIITFVYFKFAR